MQGTSYTRYLNPLRTGYPKTGTLANSEDPDKMSHFTMFCTVCLDKINLQRKKYNIFLKIMTCNPSIYTIDHPDLTVSNVMGNYGTKRVDIDHAYN